jgi:hypothetical protein
MELQIEEKRSEVIIEPPKPHNGTITFTTEEYEILKTAFCKDKGWIMDSSTNLHRIVLRGN